MLEESQDHKVNVVVVDYINILANYRNPNTENTYMKIKQIAEDLRAMAVKQNMLVISATQSAPFAAGLAAAQPRKPLPQFAMALYLVGAASALRAPWRLAALR